MMCQSGGEAVRLRVVKIVTWSDMKLSNGIDGDNNKYCPVCTEYYVVSTRYR